MSESRRVALLSLAATLLFFAEYLPPLRRMHFPYDIHGYHYPLLHYAFQSLKEGRVPEWDPTIYCGLSFAGNVQAALFYPGNWLLFAANLGRRHLSYKSVEALVILHFWLAFCLAYWWLRGRRVDTMASLLGAGAFAYSGYMLSQLNHLGVLTGSIWAPLAFWGIDQSVERRDWRPLWKVVAASALCFTSGYPPCWIAFCFYTTVYAATRHWRAALGTASAVAFSLAVGAVQLLPAVASARLKTFDPKFGLGITSPVFYASYFIPNYFDFGRNPAGCGEPSGQYLYLGAPVFFALLWTVRGRALRNQVAALTVAGMSLLVASNFLNLPLRFVERFPTLIEAAHAFNFLEGIAPAAALLTAVAIDDFLKRAGPKVPRWLAPVVIGLLAAWSVRQVRIWLPGGPDFPILLENAFEPAVMLALFCLGLFVLRAERGRRRVLMAVALLAAVWVDYKVFGTSRKFNADAGDVDNYYKQPFAGMDDAVYRELRAHDEFRIAVDDTGPFATDLRHYRLITPQGFDPFVPKQYRETIERYTPFRTDREFLIPPEKEELLRLLGVRYLVTTERGSAFQKMVANPKFRQLEPATSYFRVFEFADALPPYRFEAPGAATERTLWTPEHRAFVVHSTAGGRFVLVEQFFPGWSASIDGRPVSVERWGGAFQAVVVGPGEHRVEFRFREPGLRLGALISILSIGCLWMIARRR